MVYWQKYKELRKFSSVVHNLILGPSTGAVYPNCAILPVIHILQYRFLYRPGFVMDLEDFLGLYRDRK